MVLTNQSKGREELLRPHVETSKLADLNEDDDLKLIQLQTVHLVGTTHVKSDVNPGHRPKPFVSQCGLAVRR